MPRTSGFCSSGVVAHPREISAPHGPPDAIVVLGCRVVGGRPSRALESRLEKAGELHEEHPHLPVIMSGGKSWDGVKESQVMAGWWLARGYRTAELRQETESLTTRENALRVAELCVRLGYRHVALVTCDFHMKRAQRLFLRGPLAVTPAPVLIQRSALQRIRLAVREWGAEILGRVDSWIR